MRRDKHVLFEAMEAVEDAIDRLTALDDEDLVEDLLSTIATLEGHPSRHHASYR